MPIWIPCYWLSMRIKRISQLSKRNRLLCCTRTTKRNINWCTHNEFKMIANAKIQIHLHSALVSNERDEIFIDSETGMLPGIPGSAMCVQRFDDSLNSAIHTTYRISLRSSSLREPRDPLPKVVCIFIQESVRQKKIEDNIGLNKQAVACPRLERLNSS